MVTSVKLDEELKRKVQHLADKRQRTPHWVMREAIREYVAREEVKEQFTQEALAAWTSYQESGLHLSGQEVREWLRTWGADDESGIPPSHE